LGQSQQRTMSRPLAASHLPQDIFRRIADYADGAGVLSLHLASGRAAPLSSAFRAANELRRAARLRTEDDDAMFRRWEALVVPLRCVALVMNKLVFERVFRGAARRGVEALSALDATRLDLRFKSNADRDDFAQMWNRLKRSKDAQMLMELDQVDQEAMRQVIGAQDAVGQKFASSIIKLLEEQREVGNESPTYIWLSRHAQITFKPPGVTFEVTYAMDQLVVDTFAQISLLFLPNQIDGFDPLSPRRGYPDVAAVHAQERRQPLPPCSDPRRYTCDGCDGCNPVAYACPLCSHARCVACHQTNDHVCDARSRLMADPKTAGPFAQRMERFFSALGDHVIQTDDDVQNNIEFNRRLLAQRDWLAGVDADRKVARSKIAEGAAAHSAWLLEKYQHSPLKLPAADDAP